MILGYGYEARIGYIIWLRYYSQTLPLNDRRYEYRNQLTDKLILWLKQ